MMELNGNQHIFPEILPASSKMRTDIFPAAVEMCRVEQLSIDNT